MRFSTSFLASLIIATAIILSGCQSVYYSSLEKLGIEKRDVLVDRVEDARDEQEETKEVFADALEAFTDLTAYEGGKLEKTYDSLNRAYKRSLTASKDVSRRIDAVESVAEALFKEWKDELAAYSNESLRRQSEQSLLQTRSSYETMIRKMRDAESSMHPVLDSFQDQVLFLKHNLNARAIAALDTEVTAIQAQVKALVRQMEASIAEADAFVASMR